MHRRYYRLQQVIARRPKFSLSSDICVLKTQRGNGKNVVLPAKLKISNGPPAAGRGQSRSQSNGALIGWGQRKSSLPPVQAGLVPPRKNLPGAVMLPDEVSQIHDLIEKTMAKIAGNRGGRPTLLQHYCIGSSTMTGVVSRASLHNCSSYFTGGEVGTSRPAAVLPRGASKSTLRLPAI